MGTRNAGVGTRRSRVRLFQPLLPSDALARRCAGWFQQLMKSRAGSRIARRVAATLEHTITRVLVTGRQRAVTRLYNKVAALGIPLTFVEKVSGLQRWRLLLPSGRAEYRVQTLIGPWYHSVGVTHWKIPQLTAAQEAKHQVQQAFYVRYTKVGQRVYRARKPPPISRADRTILLIGELEADINNGGFDQYLLNKGNRRARAALSALREVRATRTASWLAAALKPGATRTLFERLDAKFYRSREDLAVLTMRHLTR